MSYRNEGDGEGTGRGAASATVSPQQQAQAHPHAGKGSRKGGQFVKKGTGSGGRSGRGTRRTTHPTNKPATSAPTPVRHGSMRTGDSGSDVADLNAVLSKLGLAQTGNSSTYLPSTEAAVMDAQRRLGLKPTGKASVALVRKLHAAAALSPCVKRSEDDTEPSVTRAYTTPREEPPDQGGAWAMTQAVTRADNPDQPYGDVTYADPGYQADGKARYPLDTPDHVRSAWSYIHQADNAALYSHKHLKKIKDRIKDAGKDHGVEFADEMPGDSMMDSPDKMGRAQTSSNLEILRYDRLWALDDIEIRRGGDGRTVEAYAAVFNTPTEIRDQHGHYMEVIDRAAFNRAISHGIDRIGVFYHHGMTLHGTPSDLGSVPIGSPVDVRADGKGLRTVSRFNKSALADSVLEAIRAGDIKGYSFRGRIFQSTPNRPAARTSRVGELSTVTRTELGLTEYGPTPTPYYADAGILAVRSRDAVAHDLRALDASTRAELLREYAVTTPPGDPDDGDNATPTTGPGAEDPPAEALRSASMATVRRKIAAFKILGGIT